MRILFFTKGNRNIASSRQRVWFIADKLKDKFHIRSIVLYGYYWPFFSFSYSRFVKFFKAVRELYGKYDIIFIHKSFISWEIILLSVAARRLFGCGLVYDIDDAQWLYSKRKSVYLAKHSDIIFCGSHEILLWAEGINLNSIYIPTAIDFASYSSCFDSGVKRKILTIGWVGDGVAHFRSGSFTVVKNALIDLQKRGYIFRFVIIGSRHYASLKKFFNDSNFEVIYVDYADWTKAEIVPNLIGKFSFDIGVMPLVDTQFNRAKCAFKAIEYMACGVPTVASRVGEAEYLIDDGVDGFLVNSEKEWVDALMKLADNPALGERMGEAAQEKIRERYSFQYTLPKVKKALESLHNQQK